jgi:hypothetical protein
VPKRAIVHARQSSEADLWPFFFRFDIPDGTEEGLLILQRTGNYGIRKTLQRFLIDSFRNDYEDLRFHLMPVVDPEQMEKYERGKVEELRFVKISLPSDLADGYAKGNEQVRGKVELVFKARRGGTLPDNLLKICLRSESDRVCSRSTAVNSNTMT